jgi:hypothetical protein
MQFSVIFADLCRYDTEPKRLVTGYSDQLSLHQNQCNSGSKRFLSDPDTELFAGKNAETLKKTAHDVHHAQFIHDYFSQSYEQPLVVPQSSQTVHDPFLLTRMELQLAHCSPVYPFARAYLTLDVPLVFVAVTS